MKRRYYAILIIYYMLFYSFAQAQEFRVLVFSKTAGFRHSSIDEGITMFQELASEYNFEADFSEDSQIFLNSNLSQYDAVVFLNTTGDILTNSEQAAFETYFRSGKGWLGVHAAADCEYTWNWYGNLLGNRAYFLSHPVQQDARVITEDRAHPCCRHLDPEWNRFDEWYNYQNNPRADVHVLLRLDTTSYSGSTMGNDHPIAWYREFDGGRMCYTGLGHTEQSYDDPAFRTHILEALRYVARKTNIQQTTHIEEVFSRNAEWKFHDLGTDLGTAWRSSSFIDNLWEPGIGKLGNGDNNQQTIVQLGPNTNRFPTIYFRKRFTLTNKETVSEMNLSMLVDDGAIVYLNGSEVLRINMPSTAVTYNTFASSSIGGADETRYQLFRLTNFSNILTEGENVLAIEIHQSSPTSPDIGFDAELDIKKLTPASLAIEKTSNNNVKLRWNNFYSLNHAASIETSNSLAPNTWAPVTNSISENNQLFEMIVPMNSSKNFFRLRYNVPSSN